MRYPLFSCPLCHITRIQKLSPHACLRTYIALIYSLFVGLHIVVVRVFHQSLETCLCEVLNLYKCIAQTWNMLPFGARLLLDLKVLTHPPSPDQFSHAPHLYTHTHTMHIIFHTFRRHLLQLSLLGSYRDICFPISFFWIGSVIFYIHTHVSEYHDFCLTVKIFEIQFETDPGTGFTKTRKLEGKAWSKPRC